ncbi:hypothetical protein PORY_000425 [Pneumocystis oryctolagi]|uniref:Uncharacterized protein n=1 Tax=Pneumocystis oryctolagi TaxID=42067 RepID=A0ACB7CF72_9ASCO|nr:hypothetical protein PORY_000425 [Pneumocystis oryctolagi]
MGSLEDMIPLLNKLQDLIFNTVGTDSIDLPQVVVVGSQSSGKSSVLENIVGKDFLPRGPGVVTRRPLILQLINVLPCVSNVKTKGPVLDISKEQEWAEFSHNPGKRYTQFSEVRLEIENETSRIAGDNKGINRLPIQLRLFSPHVINLTLVDLPGLTKIPIGDQPLDIERQVRSLIQDYIAKPNSIILAITPANVDLVNSESLKLARQVDPQRKRTIGVLTKLDLMDHGTNALDILLGRVYPLKLGFIGVVNRSQQDILINKSLKDALRYERDFFYNHPIYKNISHLCGTPYLVKSLNIILMQHIREKLPDIKVKLNTLIGQVQQEISLYDNQYLIGKNKGSILLYLVTKFSNSFISSIDGSSEISTKELCGGARIYYIFNNVFKHSLNIIDPTENLTMQNIRTAIRNSSGPRSSLFIPGLAFDILVKPQIKLLEMPCKRCVELVYEELTKVCYTSSNNELERYPRLQVKLIEIVSDLLRERLEPTSDYVESLILIQMAYINIDHPNFDRVGLISSIFQHSSKDKKNKVDKKEIDNRRKVSENAISFNGISESSLISNELANNVAKNSEFLHEIGMFIPESNTDMSFPIRTFSKSMGHINSSEIKEPFFNNFFPNDKKEHKKGQVSIPFSEKDLNTCKFPENSILHDITTVNKESLDIVNNDYDENMNERQQLEVNLIRSLIISYFNTVKETIQDQVPKAIMHFLVNYCKQNLQNKLVAELYKEELFNDLLYEDESLAIEREKFQKDLLFTAEALSHIRVINIVLEFPENVYKPVLKLLNTYSISLEYKGALLIIFLPDETEKDASIRINQQFNRVLSIRLPLNNSSIKSVEEISPWSAVYIDSNSDFCCAFCSSLLLSKNQIKYWKNLPSDNWIDMVDYWVCHGGKQDILAKLGIDSDIKFVSRVGTVFVGKYAKYKGILTENGIKLYKWKLIEKNIARTISFDIDTFISAELLALIKIHANHKFDIYSEDSKKCVIKIWVFNSDLRITNGLFCESDININNTYNKFPGIRVMKICYILIKDASVELDGNNVVFHSEMVKSLLCLLKKSNSSIPKIIRQFGIWNIGYLKRYD